jgi:hypothetical protein
MSILRSKNVGPVEAASNDPYATMLAAAMNEAKKKYDAVAKVYAGNGMTEEALRDMLWPVFKSTAPQYSHRESSALRRYSEDQMHVRRDGVNEVRTYSFALLSCCSRTAFQSLSVSCPGCRQPVAKKKPQGVRELLHIPCFCRLLFSGQILANQIPIGLVARRCKRARTNYGLRLIVIKEMIPLCSP